MLLKNTLYILWHCSYRPCNFVSPWFSRPAPCICLRGSTGAIKSSGLSCIFQRTLPVLQRICRDRACFRRQAAVVRAATLRDAAACCNGNIICVDRPPPAWRRPSLAQAAAVRRSRSTGRRGACAPALAHDQTSPSPRKAFPRRGLSPAASLATSAPLPHHD